MNIDLALKTKILPMCFRLSENSWQIASISSIFIKYFNKLWAGTEYRFYV